MVIKAKCKFKVTTQRRYIKYVPDGSDEGHNVVTWKKYSEGKTKKKGKYQVWNKKITKPGTYRVVIGAACGYDKVVGEPFTIGKVKKSSWMFKRTTEPLMSI